MPLYVLNSRARGRKLLRALLVATALLGGSAHAQDNTANAKGNPAMQPLPRPFTLSADACKAHGFPPVQVRFDLTGTPFTEFLFPDADTLASLSGPPGGPYHFSIKLVRAENGKLPALDALVKAHDRPGENFALFGRADIELNGKKVPALCWSRKPTPWADNCATALYPLADNQSALVITFSAGYDAKKGVLPGNGQALVLKSLKIVEKN